MYDRKAVLAEKSERASNDLIKRKRKEEKKSESERESAGLTNKTGVEETK